MVTLNDYKDINEVLFLLKKDVYFDKGNLNLSSDEVLDEDLIDFRVITKDGKVGEIKEIFMASENNKILRVEFDREILIPLASPMVIELSKDKKEVLVELIDGM